jgi:hypothetical protein
MLNSSQVTRSALIAATVMSIGAGPAIARPTDPPPRSRPAVTTVAPNTRPWTQARVDSMGVRPADVPAATTTPAPAVPVTQPADGSAGLQWLLFPLAALLLAFALIIGGARAIWGRTDTFRARHV